MNGLLVFGVLAVMVVLRWRKVSKLTWAVAWWLGMFLIIRYGFAVPVPISVVKLYMGIITGAIVAYVLTDQPRIEEIRGPIARFMTEKRFQMPLIGAMLAIPALFAWSIYAGMTRDPLPPAFARTVHPAPPDQISVHDNAIELGNADNPYRVLEESDPEAFAARLAAGREVYYANCFYCHGDIMAGEGMFAHALNPIPTNFQDPGTIAMLREAFLFWRIAKGAPGLPEEGGPWASAMPAWENFLSEEEMWNVVMFLYEFTDQRPRAVEVHH
jgi:mono/diheme cytochrome c family protein